MKSSVLLSRLTILLVLLCGFGPACNAQVKELRVARSDGLGYLPIILMEHFNLIEKQAKVAGLPAIKVTWARFAGGVQMNDSLLSGSLDFASGGVPPFLTLWGRTAGTPQSVKAVCALAAYPYLLVSRNPNIKSIRDLTPKDRIVLPAVKVSIQAVLLQMAAAQAFGEANYAKLDPITVSLSNPDGLIALVTGKSEIIAHFSNPPFQYQELRNPGFRTILHSYDVLGGLATSTLIWTTTKFHDDNPKLYAAFVAAFEEANAMIRSDKKSAVVLYKNVTKDTDTVENLLEMVNDMDFSPTPRNTMKFVEFMHKVGTLKTKAATWKELFLPEIHDQPGS
jgi:NitT/TauT family transport system substrate-binding protein